MQDTTPRKLPELLRILLFLLFGLAEYLLMSQVNTAIFQCVLDGPGLSFLSYGQWLMVINLLDSLVVPLLMMLLYRRFVFRSTRPLRTCILPTLCFLVAWMLVRTLLSAFAVTPSGDEASAWSAAMTVIGYAAQYVFYRRYLFRETIDTI